MLKAFYVIMAIVSVGNGLTMLAAPEAWYEEIVPGAHHTGPMNIHFQRDIGIAFLAAGAGLIWAAFHLAQARAMHVVTGIFLGGHGLLHVYDILVGHLPMEHWLYDTPTVILPGAIMLALFVPAAWRWANPEARAQA
jgi:hypothetical protein